MRLMNRLKKPIDSVHEILNTPYGAKLLDPPYKKHYFDGALMHIFNDDTKENGGIFSQSQGWIILAEALADMVTEPLSTLWKALLLQ